MESTSSYEMASISEQGLATESLNIDANSDLSIAEQSEALNVLKENNKDVIKQADQIEKENQK